MRKYFILALVLACAAYAATTTSSLLRGDASGGTSNLVCVVDSSQAAGWIAYDTFTSEVLDVLGATNIRVGINMGTWKPCDSCNDSVIITVTPYFKGVHSTIGRACATQTFGTGIANYRTADDSTRYIVLSMANDSVRAAQLYFVTIIKDSVNASFSAAEWSTVNATNPPTSYLSDLSFDVEVTKDGIVYKL